MDWLESKNFLYLGIGVLIVVVLALVLGQRLTNISLGPLDIGFSDSSAATNTPTPSDTPASPTETPVDQDDPSAPTITHTPEPTLNNGRDTPIPVPSETAIPAPTAEDGVRDPVAPVSAGTPVLVGDLALHVGPDFQLVQGGGSKPAVQIAVPIAVENRGARFDLFMYSRDSITMKDDLGTTYIFASGKKQEWSAVQQVQIPFEQTLMFDAALDFDPADPTSLPAFTGPVNPDASRLILSFSGFGPFDGVEIYIDL